MTGGKYAAGTDVPPPELRVYGPDELRRDGYPTAWPEINAHVVALAGARCLRCGHPYVKGTVGNKGEWSACDERCEHGGPLRWRASDEEEWQERAAGFAEGPVSFYFAELVAPDVEARWRILTVHHLTGSWGNTHEAKRDCRWWNLLALCQRCHLQIQGKVDPRKPYPWPHTEWFRPYAAGFYAAKYLGVDLTREETEARIDELLALGATGDAVERMPL